MEQEQIRAGVRRVESLQKQFKSIHIDLENNIYQLNGDDISKSVTGLNLEFETGTWSLSIEQIVTFSGKAPDSETESSANNAKE